MSDKFTDRLTFSNGCGYRPCTPEYRDAIETARELMADLLACRLMTPAQRRDAGIDYPALHEAAYRAEARVDDMAASGEHAGKPVWYK